MISKVKAQLITTQKRENVKQVLEEIVDEKGMLTAGDFKKTILRYVPGLSTGEVNQLSRNYEEGREVDVEKWKEDFEGDVTIKTQLPLKFVASELQKYLQ